MIMRRSGFVEPCQPSKVARPRAAPSGTEEGDEWAASPEGQAAFEKLYRR